ncbi:Tetratricopeptide repeat protein 25 [Rhizophlyctis rosea]|uniref:Outer dynein arm-docking complex subunit 4 n=1 Tax=Rhizophlyctis rosea TaxID=64517 RepID=A0AAD5SJU3_9FUNG|nr:Tetratricopeptide repeat protein 25 [Rhizophlyctis rosea]
MPLAPGPHLPGRWANTPRGGGGWSGVVAVPRVEVKEEKPVVGRSARGEGEKVARPLTDAEKSAKTVAQAFETIHNALDKELYEDAIRAAKGLLAKVNDLPKLTNRDAVIAELYGSLGTTYAAMGNTKEALQYHRKDLTIAKDQNHSPSLHRSLANLGRLYVQLHKYKEAASTFRELLSHLPTEPSHDESEETSAEHVWVLHDLGRCYYRLEEYEKAAECGGKGVTIADGSRDKRWGLDCRLLLGQSQAALNFAKELHDDRLVGWLTNTLEEAKSEKTKEGRASTTAEGRSSTTAALQAVKAI